MKYFILLLGVILLFSSVNAETTFFDQDDAFIIGASTNEESAQVGTTGGGCLTNWTCSDWSECNLLGKQTRSCTKEKANCYADPKTKPVESQNCFVDKSEDKNNTGPEDEITSSPNENNGANIINQNSFNKKIIIIISLIVIAIGVAVLFAYKKRFKNIKSKTSEKDILLKLKRLIGHLWNKHEKYPSNSIYNLINKEVYSESGHYIGKVNDVLLLLARIEELKIELDKKHKFDKKGIIINYSHVRNVGEIIIIDESISEHLGIIK